MIGMCEGEGERRDNQEAMIGLKVRVTAGWAVMWFTRRELGPLPHGADSWKKLVWIYSPNHLIFIPDDQLGLLVALKSPNYLPASGPPTTAIV